MRVRPAARLRDERTIAALAVLALAAAVAGSARAEVGVGVSITSDYRLRGVSLSDRQPALSVQFAYDSPAGPYVNLTMIATDVVRYGVRDVGVQGSVGYASRTAAGPSVDVGLTAADFHVRREHTSYAEAYVGVSQGGLSAHLYYSPNYLGQDAQTLYLSLDATTRPMGRLRLFAHAGALTPLDESPKSRLRRPQFDLKAGVVANFGRFETQLAWTRLGPETDYPGDRTQTRDALVLSASVYF